MNLGSGILAVWKITQFVKREEEIISLIMSPTLADNGIIFRLVHNL